MVLLHSSMLGLGMDWNWFFGAREKHEKELLAGLPQMSGVLTLKGQYVAACWTPVATPSAYQAFLAVGQSIS